MANTPTAWKDSPAITVAIPAYNCVGSLQRAIDSVLGQSYPEFELLIVDDCSTDGTAEVLARQTDHRIRVVRHGHNQGEAGARNTCFGEAKYPWLAFLDSDDEWFPQKLQVQVEAMAELTDEYCAIFVPYERHNLDNGKREAICETAVGEDGDWGRHFLDQCGIGAGTTMLVSKAAFARVGPYDTRLARRTDHDWLLRFTTSGGKIVQLGGEPLARVYFTAKTRPASLAQATELFLEKHRELYESQPSAVARRARATLLFQIAESCEIDRQHAGWLRVMSKCLMLDPCRAFREVIGRIYRALGRPLSRFRRFGGAATTTLGSGLHITHVINCLGDGGAEAVLHRLCTRDSSNRHTVIALKDAGKYGLLLERAGVSVHCLGISPGRVNWQELWRLWRLLRALRPDVVQTWLYHANLLGGVCARLANVRRVFWGIHHSNLEPGKARISTIFIARLGALLSRWIPTGIVCCAQRALEVHRGLGYAAHKLEVIANGYDLRYFQPDAQARLRLRADRGIDATMPVLGMVARFDPQKDHENLLRALDLLKQSGRVFRCVLAGQGMDGANKQLAAWIEAYGLHEEMMLLGPCNDVRALMSALDVHVLSSAGEAFPNVLAEAMACGTPCVTTDVGDAATIVGDTGWVVPPGDSGRLADAIAAALQARQDSLAWQARAQAARARIEDRFSQEKMVGAYRRVWIGDVARNCRPG